ncbi:integrator complex subunit 12 [Lasioglossum baleicum]|uniref:integrator complex subunit 12 n=1 Tax=Lasioglossum baleicum TaxID=434251 RepID=UPI003FCE53B6
MYEDTEDASASDTDTKDFFNALALLHSTDDDSADKLRKMLDASIEKKLGFDKTLRARVPKRSYRNTKPRRRGSQFSTDKSEKQDGKLRKNDNATKQFANVPPLVNNVIKNDWGRMKIFDGQADTEPNGKSTKTPDNATKNNYKLFESFDEEEIEVDDSNESGDIPRISIPDEGLGDGLFCKVCNGTKLGPLILLECQDCQEAYHPLCHQPPVVDVDVYDPRIVWYCNNCIDTVSTNHDPISNEKRTKKDRRGDTSKTKDSSVNVDQLVTIKESLSKNDSATFEKTTSDIVRETDGSNSNDQVVLYSKDSSPLFMQKTKSLSSNQLKKRIGSKLSVARAVTKQS